MAVIGIEDEMPDRGQGLILQEMIREGELLGTETIATVMIVKGEAENEARHIVIIEGEMMMTRGGVEMAMAIGDEIETGKTNDRVTISEDRLRHHPPLIPGAGDEGIEMTKAEESSRRNTDPGLDLQDQGMGLGSIRHLHQYHQARKVGRSGRRRSSIPST